MEFIHALDFANSMYQALSVSVYTATKLQGRDYSVPTRAV